MVPTTNARSFTPIAVRVGAPMLHTRLPPSSHFGRSLVCQAAATQPGAGVPQLHITTQHIIPIHPATPSSATLPDAASTVTMPPSSPPLDVRTLPDDGGPPRFFTPLPPHAPRPASTKDLPLLLYLPGIDGTGLAASSQFPALLQHFELRCLYTPRSDRTPFAGQVDLISAYLKEHVGEEDPTRPVYLLGESFGGVLALAVAASNPRLVDRVVLVNPATSFPRSPWPAIGPVLLATPPEAYGLLPYVLAPLLANPLNMASRVVDPDTPLADQLPTLFTKLTQQLGLLGRIADILPRDTLAWKLQLLQEGNDAVDKILGDVAQRVLVLTSDADLLIPSADEGTRLQRLLPRADANTLQGHGHALLQEAGVDLMTLLYDRGFYVQRRRLSTAAATRADLAVFGRPGPIELPTPQEVEIAGKGGLGYLRALVSPVFFSTRPDGNRQLGLGGLPKSPRPRVFVGNHQLLAADLSLLIDQFLRETGSLPRGLAHPAVFAGAAAGGRGLVGYLSTYGAVPVNGRTFYQLLAGGEDVLLFPGGVREAYHLKGQEYQLLWPDKPEFVRMAARFGATIIPFGAVGAYDSVSMLADSKELLANPLVGPWLEQRVQDVPKARAGADDEFFVPPLTAPVIPSRFYFLFGEPVETSDEDVEVWVIVKRFCGRCQLHMSQDPACEAALYQRVRGSVQQSIEYLLARRSDDPYGELAPRLLYEATWQRQAPSFVE